MRRVRARIEMKKRLAEAESAEAASARRRRQGRRIKAGERDVEGQPFVQRQRCAADPRIVQGASVAGIDASGAFIAARNRSSASSASGQTQVSPQQGQAISRGEKCGQRCSSHGAGGPQSFVIANALDGK